MCNPCVTCAWYTPPLTLLPAPATLQRISRFCWWMNGCSLFAPLYCWNKNNKQLSRNLDHLVGFSFRLGILALMQFLTNAGGMKHLCSIKGIPQLFFSFLLFAFLLRLRLSLYVIIIVIVMWLSPGHKAGQLPRPLLLLSFQNMQFFLRIFWFKYKKVLNLVPLILSYKVSHDQ